jgi:hypothetical protein
MKNKVEDLRNQLFLTLEKLQDGDMEISTAKTIADVSQVLVNLAKVEVDFIKQVEGRGTGFFPVDPERKQLT